MVAQGSLWRVQGCFNAAAIPIRCSSTLHDRHARPCRSLHSTPICASALALERSQVEDTALQLATRHQHVSQGLRPLPSLKEQREQRLQAQPLPPPHAQPVPPPATSVAGPQLFHYPFRERLLRGVILRRRARFTLEVDVDGETLLCYCPSTSMSLGGTRLDGSQVPCLLSRVDPAVRRTAAQARQTAHTVEAISLDGCASWVGTNQCTVVRYIEHFLRAGGLPEVCASADGLRAEQRVGTCRIDFVLARRDSIEVKMLPGMCLRAMPGGDKAPPAPSRAGSEPAKPKPKGGASKWRSFFQRICAQLDCMTAELMSQRAQRGLSRNPAYRQVQLARRGAKVDVPRAMMLLCYQHDEPRVRLPKRQPGAEPSPLHAAMCRAKLAGVEFWQVNMRIDETGVTLASYAPLNLFPGRLQSHIARLKGHDYLAAAAAAALIPDQTAFQAVVPGEQHINGPSALRKEAENQSVRHVPEAGLEGPPEAYGARASEWQLEAPLQSAQEEMRSIEETEEGENLMQLELVAAV